MALCDMQAPPESLQLYSYSNAAAFWNISGGQWWREILPVDRIVSSDLFVHLTWKEKWLDM